MVHHALGHAPGASGEVMLTEDVVLVVVSVVKVVRAALEPAAELEEAHVGAARQAQRRG